MRDPVEVFLSSLHHPMLASIDLKLDRMLRLLAMLGSPHKRLPPVIHVAGTNGKGSLLAYLQSVLECSGYKVHKYTSPHLVHFRERIILQGREIDNAYVTSIVKHVAPMLANQPATFFEAATAVAFLAYAEYPADVLLLETGMGGRLDATNVIDKPLLTAITPVSMDHTEYLGSTLAVIAGEKAGIIKRGTPCVVGKQEAEALAVIEAKAKELEVPLYQYGADWQCSWHEGYAEYASPKRRLSYTPSLAGNFQYDNAATAIACLDMLPQFTLSDAQIKEGLARAVWPARLQKLTTGGYAVLVPNCEIWLDGGHNPQGGEVLGDWLGDQNKDIYLICGMMKGKDARNYLRPLAPYVKQFYAVVIPEENNCQSVGQLVGAARDLGMEAHEAGSVEKALQSIAMHATTPFLICICGSLYLAGQVLAANTQDSHTEKRNATGTYQ